MQHVHVASHQSHFEYDRIRQTKNGLISLVHTLEVSLKTEKGYKLHKNIDLTKEYRNKVIESVPGSKLYLDSGGYSIIKGDVPFDRILSFIDKYHDFMAKNCHLFDYIFSLDIPFGFYAEDEKEKPLHNYDVIYNLNKISMQKTLDLLKAKPELKDKLYFIQHFKLHDQFKIWNDLEAELGINDKIIHRSIGGLVSLKKMVRHFKRTTFLPMIFRSFYNFLQVYEKNKPRPVPDLDIIANRVSWRIPLKELFKPVDQLSSYAGLKPSEKTTICEQLIDSSILKNHIKDSSQYEELAGILKRVLDVYFKKPKDKQHFENLVDQILDNTDIKTDAGIEQEEQEFRLHVLGVFNLQDRNVIALVEKLLNNHCINEGLPIKVHITYDSISYTNQALKNFKHLKYFMDDLQWHSLEEVDDVYLEKVYLDKSDLVKREISKLNDVDRMLYADTFSPLNIYSNLNVDKHLEYAVGNPGRMAEALVKILSDAYDGSRVISQIADLFYSEVEFLHDLARDAGEPVLSKRMAARLNDDIRTIIRYYLLLRMDAGLDAINSEIEKYVTEIDFPFDGFI